MTKLYWADVRALEEETLFRKLYARVNGQRKAKIDALRFPADKARSLGAGLLLEAALRDWGCSGELLLSRGEWGKPCLAERPDVHFNLSHSGDLVLCAVSHGEVGCDVQRMDGWNPGLAERFFSPEETAWLFSLPEGERCAGFYRLWTLKESFVKATGLGLSLKFPGFSMVMTEAAPRVNQTRFPGKAFFFREWTVAEGYCCACCAGEDAFVPPEEVKLVLDSITEHIL